MKKTLFFSFAFVTVLFALIYLCACLTPYISPQSFWPMAFLALGYFYLASGIFILMIAWLFVRKKIGLLLLVVLLAGYPNLFSTFAFHLSTKSVAKPPGTIRIMTWNVRGFDNPSDFQDTAGSVRQRMFDYIRDSAPDVICIQEFAEHKARSLISNTTQLLDIGYNYFYRTDELFHRYHWGCIKSGTAIFSKIPIEAFGQMIYNDSSWPEHICFIDVRMNDRPLRIFSTHFKSLNLDAVMLDSNARTYYHGDNSFIYTASKFEKLKAYPRDHAVESEMARDFINKSPYPFVFCGDLNTVPASYPYHIMSHGLQDAFLQFGSGLGTTMDSLPKPLRIDYFLVDKRISIKNYVRNEVHLSDHFPQIIDVTWKQ